MSRERKLYRDTRRQAHSSDWFWDMVAKVASVERRRLRTVAHWKAYVRELLERGVIVDQGPHPSGVGIRISFRFDRIAPGSLGLEFDNLETVLAMLGDASEGGSR